MNNSSQQITEHQILEILFQSSYSLTPGDIAGAHTQIFKTDPNQLAVNLLNLLEKTEDNDKVEARREIIETFAHDFASKYLLKIGRISEFAMKLGTSKPLVAPRSSISEIFGSAGYSLYPTWEKTLRDASEACREIPYFFNGNSNDIFIEDIVSHIKALLTGKEFKTEEEKQKAYFLINTETNEKLTFFDFIQSDKYGKIKLSTPEELEIVSENIRKSPFTTEMEVKLKDFFNAPITVGVRDVLRWFAGSRHPDFNWDEAKNIIESCFEKHGNENFLLPEINYYMPSAAVTTQEILNLKENNKKVINVATQLFKNQLSEKLQSGLSDDFLYYLFESVFEYHHGYPQYKISDAVGLLNPDTAGLALRFAEHFAYFLNGIKLPERRNADFKSFFRTSGWNDKFRQFMNEEEIITFKAELLEFLLKYDIAQGLRTENEKLVYKRIPTTFHTIQENALWLPKGHGKIAAFSLEDLTSPEYSIYLRKYPELSEKLVVFFTLVLRFFLETDFIPDLRPNEAGINIFILGIWGYLSDNLLIVIHKDQKGNEHVKIKFVDNKDHFKRYKREIDRNNPMGMAKYAMKIAEPVVLPAMLRAIGNFAQIVYENRNGLKQKQIDLKGIISYGLMVAEETVTQGVSNSITSLESIILDGIDDSVKFTKGVLNNIIETIEDE